MENLNFENVELKAEEELSTVNDLVTLGQVKANYTPVRYNEVQNNRIVQRYGVQKDIINDYNTNLMN